jgi:hypothetical protein
LKLNCVRVVQCDLFDLAGLKTTWMIVKKSMRMKLRKKVEIEIKKGWKNGVTELKKKSFFVDMNNEAP